jgi:D-aspartate ligase
MGDMDLVRPLGLAGIRCAVAVAPGAASRFSRFTQQTIDWANPWDQPERLVDSLIQFGRGLRERPVLFFESDAELLLVSRNRERLNPFFRFAIADQELVEDLVDKERFQALAKRMRLPVPASRRLYASEPMPVDLGLRYPIVVKPLTRRPQTWKAVAPQGKALRIDSVDELRELWPRLAVSGVDVLAQEIVPGPETSVESYHVYVNKAGEITGEFTGRKIRTYPREYGDSTALETTDQEDVASLGRAVTRQLGLRGVAKFDFKRAPDGSLQLLEINPRYNLWHHLGAIAGVNLPVLSYFDLLNQQVPSPAKAVAGLRWCRMWQDVLAARQNNVSLFSWISWALGCESKRLLAWDDPKPLVYAGLWRLSEAVKSKVSQQEARSKKISPAIVTSDAA